MSFLFNVSLRYVLLMLLQLLSSYSQNWTLNQSSKCRVCAAQIWQTHLTANARMLWVCPSWLTRKPSPLVALSKPFCKWKPFQIKTKEMPFTAKARRSFSLWEVTCRFLCRMLIWSSSLAHHVLRWKPYFQLLVSASWSNFIATE